MDTEKIKSWLIKNMITFVESDEDIDDKIPIIEREDEYAYGWNDCIRHLIKHIEQG